MAALEPVGDSATPVSRADLAARLNEIVENGVHVFLDVGLALCAIKIDKLYRELGYTTFDHYCEDRHGIGPRRRAQLMVAASIAENVLIESGTTGTTFPTTERQVRPLTLLRNDDDKREAWAEAVEAADGGQPTAKQVTEAVAKHKPPITETDEQRHQREAEEALQRSAKRLEMFCSSWHQFRDLRTNPNREAILARLTDSDRQVIDAAEEVLGWTS